MLKNVSFKCKENHQVADRAFCCCAPCRREIGFFRVPFFCCFSFSCFRARILFKSGLHGIHLATLCVLLSWPPDKRTLVLGPCFFQSSFFVFLPHCPAPDKRTYRAHGPAESASSAPASCAYITNPRPVTSALRFCDLASSSCSFLPLAALAHL